MTEATKNAAETAKTEAAAKAEQEKAAAAAKIEAEKAAADYAKLTEPERLRVDLAKLDTEPEDVMQPDAKMKRRQAILDRLRELYEPVVAPAPPPEPQPQAQAHPTAAQAHPATAKA
jgi:hypothetical protein